MKLLKFGLTAFIFLFAATPAFAAGNAVTSFTSSALNFLIPIATVAATLFIIIGGYQYITSAGHPEELEHAKITLRNAILGLVIVLAASFIASLFSHAFTTPSGNFSSAQIALTPIQPTTPSNGLTQVLIDAISSFMQNIIQSATKPLVDGIVSFLTTTPLLATNSVVFNFWLVMVGITDSLFALVVAILGFHLMSAHALGFDEIEFKHMLPRLGFAFLLANTSIFWIDWIIQACNALVNTVIAATGGITGAWILNAFDPAIISNVNNVAIITLIFMILFIILAVVLLLFYITRLIFIAFGAVMAPLVFLIWTIPKFSDFAEISIKSYIVSVFTVFVHVVIIQLASSFLAVPSQSGTTNPLISILIAIGLLLTLLKTPSLLMQLIFYNAGGSLIKKVGGQIMNVMSTDKGEDNQKEEAHVKKPRRAVAI